MEQYKAFAAFRYGKLLYGMIGFTRKEVELWVRACYQQELNLKLHQSDEVLLDHGIEVCEIEIRKVGKA